VANDPGAKQATLMAGVRLDLILKTTIRPTVPFSVTVMLRVTPGGREARENS
jgi:hypothetical protein